MPSAIQAKMSDGISNMLKSNKKAKQADLQVRLEACSSKGANSRCAECPARNPKWASILVPPASATIMGSLTTDGKKNRKMATGRRILGVFICQKCSNFHLEMGRSVCAVKNVKAADQWTEEEVVIMEMSGNEVTNLIYEATIEPEEKEALNTVKDPNQQVEIRMQYVQKKYIDMAYFSEINIRKFLQFRYAPKIYGTIPEFCQQARYDNMVARDPELQEQIRKQREEEAAAAAATAAARTAGRQSVTAAFMQNAFAKPNGPLGAHKLGIGEMSDSEVDPDPSRKELHASAHAPNQHNNFADFSDPDAFNSDASGSDGEEDESNNGDGDDDQKDSDDDDGEDHRLDFLAQLGNKRRNARQRSRSGPHGHGDEASLTSDAPSYTSQGKPSYKGIAQELEASSDAANRRRGNRRGTNEQEEQGGDAADDFSKRARARRPKQSPIRPSSSAGALEEPQEGQKRNPRRTKSVDGDATEMPRSRHRRSHLEEENNSVSDDHGDEAEAPRRRNPARTKSSDHRSKHRRGQSGDDDHRVEEHAATARINRKPLRRSKSALDAPIPSGSRPRRSKSDDGGLVHSLHGTRGGRRPPRRPSAADELDNSDEDEEFAGSSEAMERRGSMERTGSIAGRRQQMEHRQRSRRNLLTPDPTRRQSRRNLMAGLDAEPAEDVDNEESSPKSESPPPADRRAQMMKRAGSRRALMAADISRRQSRRALMANMDQEDEEEEDQGLNRKSNRASRLEAAQALNRSGGSMDMNVAVERKSKAASRLAAAESLNKSGHNSRDLKDGLDRKSKRNSRLAAAESLSRSGHSMDLEEAVERKSKASSRLAAAESLSRSGMGSNHKNSLGSSSGDGLEHKSEKRESMLALAEKTKMLAKLARSEQEEMKAEKAVLSGAAAGDDTMYNTAAELRTHIKALSLNQ